MSEIFVEENGMYQIDLSKAECSFGDLNEKYKSIGHIFSNVDWIAETDSNIFMIEYKNDNIKKAREQINTAELVDKLVKKYYGGAFYILSCGKTKSINYICIIESVLLDSVIRKKITAKIKKQLPYVLNPGLHSVAKMRLESRIYAKKVPISE